MAHNRYFIIDSNDPNKEAIFSFSIENEDSCRCNNDKTKIVIKLFEDDHEQHSELSSYTEYSHDEILTEMQNSEWIGEDV